MARDKIDWDVWLDKPFAKLWIAIVVLVIISAALAFVAFPLAMIMLLNSHFKYLRVPTIIICSIQLFASLLFQILNIIYNSKRENLFKSWRTK